MDNGVYVINPRYSLRREGNVVIIHSNESQHFSTEGEEDILCFIHLLTAQLLSVFDGNRTYEEALQHASSLVKVDSKVLNGVLSKYIENKNGYSILTDQDWQYIPSYILIKKDLGVGYRKYNPENFLSSSFPPFSTLVRLKNPLRANLLLTMRCAVDCIYCYANRRIQGELPIGRLKEIIQEGRRLEMSQMDINGGDVFLYKDWKQVVVELKRNSFAPLLSTKIPLSEESIADLADIGIDRIQISLDSSNHKILSSLLGVQGALYLSRLQKSLASLEAKGIEVQINSVLSSQNPTVENLSDLFSLLSAYKNIRHINITPAGYSLYKGAYKDYAPTKSDVDKMTGYLPELQEQYPHFRVQISEGEPCYTSDPTIRKNRFDRRAFCTGNTRSFVMLPDGRVTICEELYDHPAFLIGDLSCQTIEEVWNSEKAERLFHFSENILPADSQCSMCHSQKQCREGKGVCWKVVLMAYGSDKWYYPDPSCPFSDKVPIRKYWID